MSGRKSLLPVHIARMNGSGYPKLLPTIGKRTYLVLLLLVLIETGSFIS